MAFGMNANCRNKGPNGAAAMALAFLQNVKDEEAPAALVSTAQRTVIREPMLIQRPGNFSEIAESNTLRKGNQILMHSTNKRNSSLINKNIEYFCLAF